MSAARPATSASCAQGGVPREANAVGEVGGVRTLFRMPDLLSIGLGGGTEIAADSLEVGPGSVGYRLTSEALVFGGRQLTATDIAVAAGIADIGDRRSRGRPRSQSRPDRDDAHTTDRASMLEENIDRMKTEAGDAPLVAVGGGAFLVPETLAEGASQSRPGRAPRRLCQRGRRGDCPCQRRGRSGVPRSQPRRSHRRRAADCAAQGDQRRRRSR